MWRSRLGLVALALISACGDERPDLEPPALEIGLDELPGGEVGASYDAPLRAFGGLEVDYRWRIVEGALPPGLFLRSESTPSTTIYGVPMSAGAFAFTVEVRDPAGATDRAQLELEIRPGPEPVRITTMELPGASHRRAYSALVEAEGEGELAWHLVSGALPPGIEIIRSEGPSALLEGRPSVPGRFSFTLRVERGDGSRDARAFSIEVVEVDGRLELLSARLPVATSEVRYAVELLARGGSGAGYRWAVISGELPPGLELEPEGTPTATVSGVPRQRGSYAFRVEVRDDANNVARQAFFIEVRPGDPRLRVTIFELPAGEVGVPYEAALRATGGSGLDYTWSLSQGQLPAGLALESGTPSARLAGTPEEAGRFTILVRVEDSVGQRNEALFELAIAEAPPALTITATNTDARGIHVLPEARVGETYGGRLVASGGAPATTDVRYNWVVSGGRLPPGLSLLSAGQGPGDDGRFSGAPSQAGTFEATVQVYDNRNATDDQRVEITVRP